MTEPSALTFSSSNWSAEQTVTMTGVADNLSDGDQSFAILLSDNTTSDTRYQYVDPPDVSLKNLDLTDKGSFYVSAVSNDTDESDGNRDLHGAACLAADSGCDVIGCDEFGYG